MLRSKPCTKEELEKDIEDFYSIIKYINFKKSKKKIKKEIKYILEDLKENGGIDVLDEDRL